MFNLEDNPSGGFIKMQRNNVTFDLLRERPSAFCLLTLIALRTKRTRVEDFRGIGIGEARIGDYKEYGVTEAIYKTDKAFLERHRLVDFIPTPRGTIAKLKNTNFFDINFDSASSSSTGDNPLNEPSATYKRSGND